jgi:hypothetical protein
MTLHLRPETADALAALAHTNGLSIQEYLEALVNRERLGQPTPFTTAQPIRPKRMPPRTMGSRVPGMGRQLS